MVVLWCVVWPPSYCRQCGQSWGGMTVVHQVIHTACQREEDRQEDRLERSLLGRLSLSSRNNNNVKNNVTRELILHFISPLLISDLLVPKPPEFQMK